MIKGYSFDDVLLVPRHSTLNSRSDADISGDLVKGLSLDVPIISANMPAVTDWTIAAQMRRAGGLGALHRFCDIDEAVAQFECTRTKFDDPTYDDPLAPYAAINSLGFKDGIERAKRLVDVGARLFLLDVAHGDHDLTYKFIRDFRSDTDLANKKLIVGNFATRLSIMKLIESVGPIVDAVKVGIGPGAACTTRTVTGFGVPQLTAIMEVRGALDKYAWDAEIKLIADGGIKNSGDIVKALAAGADTVMVGRLLAGVKDSPNGLEYFGNASARVNGHRAPEGATGVVEPSGTVADVMKELAWGIRSGVSYAGVTSAKSMRHFVEFTEVSPLTHIETSVRI